MYSINSKLTRKSNGSTCTIIDRMWSRQCRSTLYTVQYSNGLYRRYIEAKLKREFERVLDRPTYTVNTTRTAVNSTCTSKDRCVIINLYFEYKR